jgi:acyl carrier protein
MFTLGPRWRAVHELRSGGDDRLVALRLPAAFAADLRTHPLHPALLDCATGAARDDTEPFHVPFLYRRMVVHAPLPAELTGHVRRRKVANGLIVADVDLLDPDGRVLVRIEGFTMRQVDRSSMDGEPAAATAVDEPDTAGDAPPPEEAAVGIPPTVGVDLVLTLLSARTPERVVVRPFRDGRPVPLPEDDGPPGSPPAAAGPAAPVAFRPAAAAPTAAPAPAVAAVPPPSAPPPAAPSPAPPTANGSAPTVERLRLLWADTLGIDDIAADDDFFELGGNSLSAVELMSRVRDTFGVELNIGLLFDAPTLDRLTALLEQQNGKR